MIYKVSETQVVRIESIQAIELEYMRMGITLDGQVMGVDFSWYGSGDIESYEETTRVFNEIVKLMEQCDD